MEHHKSYDHTQTMRAGLALIFLIACTSWAGGSQLSVSPHPRLFFTAENIEQFRERIGQDEVLRQAWQKMRERADRLLEEELVSKEYSEGGAGQHGNYGRPSKQVVTMGSTLGLARPSVWLIA